MKSKTAPAIADLELDLEIMVKQQEIWTLRAKKKKRRINEAKRRIKEVRK